MDVILMHDVPNVGERGETKSVADGYARNYLFPQGLAVRADTAKVAELEMRLKALEARDNRNLGSAQEKAKALEGYTLNLKSAASDEDKLYGSVTAQVIAQELQNAGHEVKHSQIHLAEPIRELGEFGFTVRMHREVEVDLKVIVERA